MDMPDRKWPSNVIKKAPVWCSVDLRDGNQALEKPMNLDQKIKFFKFLVARGFKEIGVFLFILYGRWWRKIFSISNR